MILAALRRIKDTLMHITCLQPRKASEGSRRYGQPAAAATASAHTPRNSVGHSEALFLIDQSSH